MKVGSTAPVNNTPNSVLADLEDAINANNPANIQKYGKEYGLSQTDINSLIQEAAAFRAENSTQGIEQHQQYLDQTQLTNDQNQLTDDQAAQSSLTTTYQFNCDQLQQEYDDGSIDYNQYQEQLTNLDTQYGSQSAVLSSKMLSDNTAIQKDQTTVSNDQGVLNGVYSQILVTEQEMSNILHI